MVVTEDSVASLGAILAHSLFQTQEELLEQLDSIPSKKGTKIVIWNIRRNKDGKPELDFETDPHDIRIPDLRSEQPGSSSKKGCREPERADQTVPEMDYSLRDGKPELDFETDPHDIRIPDLRSEQPGSSSKKGCREPERADQTVPEMDYSLREYCSILYLKPRTQIFLRQKKVQTKLIAKSLANIEHDVYKPNFIACLVGVDSDSLLCLDLCRGSPDQHWVQCEECLKWRKLPFTEEPVPEPWYCHLNPDPKCRSCIDPEEPEESEDELTPSYEKTFKKQ
ncbi:UNVERIFIED_CONTAM: hypothetical protein FKN15_075107 [Acipenser sinensis]